ncbi:hypothetical protein QE152_g37565 [Popillia japonica]|uniref:Uncharacterized protein n=1 Tax=Popillia japonica TaxID=7064 RepID=A0AAW1I9V7_POPJA
MYYRSLHPTSEAIIEELLPLGISHQSPVKSKSGREETSEEKHFPNSMRINCGAATAVAAMMFRKQEVPVATVDW